MNNPCRVRDPSPVLRGERNLKDILSIKDIMKGKSKDTVDPMKREPGLYTLRNAEKARITRALYIIN